MADKLKNLLPDVVFHLNKYLNHHNKYIHHKSLLQKHRIQL